jgi:anti-sigma B factor antagonist
MFQTSAEPSFHHWQSAGEAQAGSGTRTDRVAGRDVYFTRMSLTLNTRQANSYTIIEAAGHIEAGESCMRFNEFVKRLIAGNAKFLIVDMAAVSYIDSAGLGLLLSIYATLRLEGGNLKLLNVGAPVKEALTITNLLQIFEIHDDEEKATA